MPVRDIFLAFNEQLVEVTRNYAAWNAPWNRWINEVQKCT